MIFFEKFKNLITFFQDLLLLCSNRYFHKALINYSQFYYMNSATFSHETQAKLTKNFLILEKCSNFLFKTFK